MSVTRTVVTRREWEDLARLDPFWAILSDNSKQFGKWDREEFFASGRQEIETLMKTCGLMAGNNGRVLDFGCGVGRLSRALRSYFADVYGVDISTEMIRLAKENTPSCTFLINQGNDLSMFQDDFFDFVYSNIVLQHQSTQEIARSYIRDFVRITKPGGMIVFQVPYRLGLRGALQPRRRVFSLLRTLGFSADFLYNKLRLSPMRTICLPSEDVRATVTAAGGKLERSYSDHFNYYSRSYVASKGTTSPHHNLIEGPTRQR